MRAGKAASDIEIHHHYLFSRSAFLLDFTFELESLRVPDRLPGKWRWRRLAGEGKRCSGAADVGRVRRGADSIRLHFGVTLLTERSIRVSLQKSLQAGELYRIVLESSAIVWHRLESFGNHSVCNRVRTFCCNMESIFGLAYAQTIRIAFGRVNHLNDRRFERRVFVSELWNEFQSAKAIANCDLQFRRRERERRVDRATIWSVQVQIGDQEEHFRLSFTFISPTYLLFCSSNGKHKQVRKRGSPRMRSVELALTKCSPGVLSLVQFSWCSAHALANT